MSLDPRDFVYKPPRVMGDVPTDYDGLLYYRISSLRSPTSRFGFRDFGKAHKLIEQRLPGTAYYGVQGLEPGRVVDEHGNLLPEFAEPIQVRVDRGVRASDWELRTSPPLVSGRVKGIIEEFEPGKAVFLPIDAAWPDGRVDRYYWAVWGRLWGPATDDFVPPRWLDPTLGDQEFHYVSASRVEGRHFIYGSPYIIVCEPVFRRFGDVLLPQQVFVPVGVE
jgi:hypothetical protein